MYLYAHTYFNSIPVYGYAIFFSIAVSIVLFRLWQYLILISGSVFLCIGID